MCHQPGTSRLRIAQEEAAFADFDGNVSGNIPILENTFAGVKIIPGRQSGASRVQRSTVDDNQEEEKKERHEER